MIMQQSEPDDYVLATGHVHSVREFVEHSFDYIGRRIDWEGKDVNEKGRCAKTGEILVAIDPRMFRKTEVDYLQGDASKARQKLGWQHKIPFEDMIAEMISADLKLLAAPAPRQYHA